MAHWHWNCASSFCTDNLNFNWRSKIPGLTYYYLEEIKNRDDIKPSYIKILKNSNINWKKGVICSQHWSSGQRRSVNDLPDIICASSYLNKRKKSKKKTKQRKTRLHAGKSYLEGKNDPVITSKKHERRALVSHQLPQGESTTRTTVPTAAEFALKEQLKKTGD